MDKTPEVIRAVCKTHALPRTHYYILRFLEVILFLSGCVLAVLFLFFDKKQPGNNLNIVALAKWGVASWLFVLLPAYFLEKKWQIFSRGTQAGHS
ncbi:MAG: hypothetical protein ACYDIB_10480 [Desulfobulbia bacterium]